MDFDTLKFSPKSNLIMACHLTGVYDVNRNNTLDDDNYEWVRNWAESVAIANIRGLIFHNNFSKETCDKYQNDHISFIKIDYNHSFNPNVYRYFVYRDFLQRHQNTFKSIFITDVSDVVIVRSPFEDPYFTKNPTAIFCGDEPKTLDDDWMKDHGAHLRKNIQDYAAYENKFAKETLLNCGIIGGTTSIFLDFLQKLCEIHLQANSENKTAFTGDMGVFNYLARTQFNTKLRHGAPINTVFKRFENERKDCWFRHK